MNNILNWIRTHDIDIGLFFCGCLLIWQGIYGVTEGEFIAVFRRPTEFDQRPMWRVGKKAAKWIGAFLIILGIGCFITVISRIMNT